jgi:hypothetical protein
MRQTIRTGPDQTIYQQNLINISKAHPPHTRHPHPSKVPPRSLIKFNTRGEGVRLPNVLVLAAAIGLQCDRVVELIQQTHLSMGILTHCW